MTLEAQRIAARPVPTPISAVSIGRPAATMEPKVISSTTIATTTPMPSVEPMAGACAHGAAAQFDPQAVDLVVVGDRGQLGLGRLRDLGDLAGEGRLREGDPLVGRDGPGGCRVDDIGDAGQVLGLRDDGGDRLLVRRARRASCPRARRKRSGRWHRRRPGSSRPAGRARPAPGCPGSRTRRSSCRRRPRRHRPCRSAARARRPTPPIGGGRRSVRDGRAGWPWDLLAIGQPGGWLGSNWGDERLAGKSAADGHVVVPRRPGIAAAPGKACRSMIESASSSWAAKLWSPAGRPRSTQSSRQVRPARVPKVDSIRTRMSSSASPSLGATTCASCSQLASSMAPTMALSSGSLCIRTANSSHRSGRSAATRSRASHSSWSSGRPPGQPRSTARCRRTSPRRPHDALGLAGEVVGERPPGDSDRVGDVGDRHGRIAAFDGQVHRCLGQRPPGGVLLAFPQADGSCLIRCSASSVLVLICRTLDTEIAHCAIFPKRHHPIERVPPAYSDRGRPTGRRQQPTPGGQR